MKSANKSKSEKHSAAAPQTPILPPPMRPRWKLFWILAGVLVIWIGLLIAMYFTTVRPREERIPTPESSASAWFASEQGAAVGETAHPDQH
jgi:hypothetical protein